MAEPLKNLYGPEIPRKISAMISAVHPSFNAQGFVHEALTGYTALEFLERGRHMARVLRRHLPDDFAQAARILTRSLGPKFERTDYFGMAPFVYLPYVFYIAENGLDHFEAAMNAQYEITQRFTAEYSIRSYLLRYPERTLKHLRLWTGDSNPHVRRLVSEGTRPRLPWAPRLPLFQKDPRPVLELLELLKDDPEPYVRRSVANNLNDIGKDNPAVLYETARRWMKGAGPERRNLIAHALRSAIKAGARPALGVLGYGDAGAVKIERASVEKNGNAVRVAFELRNRSSATKRVLVDFRIHYRKASGRSAPKVFKLRAEKVGPGQTAFFSKKVSLLNMTTRKHHPGRHEVEALVNGTAFHLGSFVITRP